MDWNKPVDVVGMCKGLLSKITGPLFSFLATFKEIRGLRRHLQQIAEHRALFQIWEDKDHVRRYGGGFWIRLGTLVFKVNRDDNKLRKLLCGGDYVIPTLYTLSSEDAEIDLCGALNNNEVGIAIKNGKASKIDLRAVDSWWAKLNEECGQVASNIAELKHQKEKEKVLLLEEAKRLMEVGSKEREQLLKMWSQRIPQAPPNRFSR